MEFIQQETEPLFFVLTNFAIVVFNSQDEHKYERPYLIDEKPVIFFLDTLVDYVKEKTC